MVAYDRDDEERKDAKAEQRNQPELIEPLGTVWQRICAIDNGRFRDVFALFGEDKLETCNKCHDFNPRINDIYQAYRCHCMPSCPAATLSNSLLNYIWQRM